MLPFKLSPRTLKAGLRELGVDLTKPKTTHKCVPGKWCKHCADCGIFLVNDNGVYRSHVGSRCMQCDKKRNPQFNGLPPKAEVGEI